MKIWASLKKLLRKSTSATSVKYFQSTSDIILYNWFKCIEGDVRYCRKGWEHDDSETTAQDREAWDVVYNSYIQKYGLSSTYKEYMRLQVKLANAKATYIETSKRFHLNTIEILQKRVDDMSSRMKGGTSYDDALVFLSEQMHFYIDKTKVTADFYFNALNFYGRNSKKG